MPREGVGGGWRGRKGESAAHASWQAGGRRVFPLMRHGRGERGKSRSSLAGSLARAVSRSESRQASWCRSVIGRR